MKRKTLILAGGVAALMSSGVFAQSLPHVGAPNMAASMPAMPASSSGPRTYPNSQQIGPITITPPSDADRQRLIVDVALHPININLYAGATRVAAKESVTYPAGTYYSFKEAVDLPGLPPKSK